MKTRKYFVRFIDTNVSTVSSYREVLEIIFDCGNYPLSITPLDSSGNPLHEYTFLVGDYYSLSFLFNNNDF